MDVPQALLKEFNFKTDLKSMLRGLNSILGLNLGMRSRLRSIRVTNTKIPMLVTTQFDLIKFILTTESLPDSAKALKYDENTDTFEFTNSLNGDPKEVLFIFENVDALKYSKDILNTKTLKPEAVHFYTDELSALLDSYQINNGLIYLYNDASGLYIVNRALTPDPIDVSRSFFYLKLFKLSNSLITKKTNFVEINRFDLTVKSHSELSTADLSHMILPVVHITK